MDNWITPVMYTLGALFMCISLYMKAKSLRTPLDDKKYKDIKGEILRRKSAIVDGIHRTWGAEYNISSDRMGIRFSSPEFYITEDYCNITLKKNRAIIGSLVQICMNGNPIKVEISHRLAKKIDNISSGNFGYKNL